MPHRLDTRHQAPAHPQRTPPRFPTWQLAVALLGLVLLLPVGVALAWSDAGSAPTHEAESLDPTAEPATLPASDMAQAFPFL